MILTPELSPKTRIINALALLIADIDQTTYTHTNYHGSVKSTLRLITLLPDRAIQTLASSISGCLSGSIDHPGWLVMTWRPTNNRSGVEVVIPDRSVLMIEVGPDYRAWIEWRGLGVDRLGMDLNGDEAGLVVAGVFAAFFGGSVLK